MSDFRDRQTANINLTIQHLRGFQQRLGIVSPELRAEMSSMVERLKEIRKMPDEEREKALKGLTQRYGGGTL